MADTLEYIEAYFQQTLNEDGRRAFEKRCESDMDFAKEVAFYITARQVLREELLAQKQQQWKDEKPGQEDNTPVISMKKKPGFGRWLIYAAAACLLLAASVFLFEANTSLHQLAKNYAKENYTSLSQTMDGDLKDSLQLGISAYNNKEYNKAAQIFESVEKNHPENSDAKKYAGLAYLQQENYGAALQQFDKLANTQGLFSNPGDFLKAVTLLKRNNPGDEKEAEQLLKKVVNENEEGSSEASAWLKKF